ncbi:MAG: 4-hydroxy-tetrahydrodipicolinate synthase [Pseudomonadota bacterium]
MFQGSLVALVTPMSESGDLDFAALERLVEFHVAAGTHGLVAAGTTGEAITLTDEEYESLLRRTLGLVAGRIPVLAGSGSSCTRTTIALSRLAERCGVDGCLIATPAYNKPMQSGLLQHYQAVASAVDLPIILYNVPGRTACDMTAETVCTLSRISNIVGIKEATGSIERGIEILDGAESDFVLLSGDDPTAVSLMEAGAKGVISVTANVAPTAMAKLCNAALAGDFATAKELDSGLRSLHQVLFIESNPIPTKWALSKMGLISNGIRLPLTPLSEAHHGQVESVIANAGV